MAATFLRLNQNNKAISFLAGLFSVLLLIQKSGAIQYKVGGDNGWTVPTDPIALHFNQWAEHTRFQIGDSLLFVYPPEDSVLHVSADDYTNCNTDSPIEKFSGGRTDFSFTQSGPYHFISGNKDNCLKNEKMVVVVLADRTNTTDAASPPPPSNITPSPAPTGEPSPSPPPTVDSNPSTSPTSDQTPTNDVSSIIIGFIGSFGGLISSYLLFAF